MLLPNPLVSARSPPMAWSYGQQTGKRNRDWNSSRPQKPAHRLSHFSFTHKTKKKARDEARMLWEVRQSWYQVAADGKWFPAAVGRLTGWSLPVPWTDSIAWCYFRFFFFCSTDHFQMMADWATWQRKKSPLMVLISRARWRGTLWVCVCWRPIWPFRSSFVVLCSSRWKSAVRGNHVPAEGAKLSISFAHHAVLWDEQNE